MKYSELPKSYIERANNALSKQEKWNALDISESLDELFTWSETPEDHWFWRTVHNARNLRELPDIPNYGIRGEADNMEYTKEYFDNQKKGPKHYSSMKIEPIDYILENELGWCEANVIKYVTRHKQKGGSKDIKKAIHYLELLLEHEYNNGKN